MIQSIEIKNLRGIREGNLDALTPLTVLVGPNGCGKSTILDALILAGLGPRSPSFGPPSGLAEAVAARHGRLREWPRWLYWRGGGHGECVIVARSENGFRMTVRLGGLPPTTLSVFEEAPSGAAPTTLPPVEVERVWVPEICLLEARSQFQNAPLHRLYTHVVTQGYQKELTEIVRQVLPGAERIEILTEVDSPVLHVVYPDRSVPAEFVGDGIHALLRLAMEVVRPAGALVLIEEPEVHQHPGTMRQAARAIWAAVRMGVQVVLTTHSLELIDVLLAKTKPEELEKFCLFRLNLRDGALLAKRLTGSEVAFARNEIEDDLR